MKTSRRDFIKTASVGTLGFGFLQNFDPLSIYPPKSPEGGLPRNTEGGLLPRRSPESQGVSAQGISNFLQAAEASGLEWHSFMLLRHGNVVAEGWWKPFASDFKHTLYSLSKSFTSTAIGLLVKEGKLSVDDSVVSFFKNEMPDVASDNLKAMKIKHLLTVNNRAEHIRRACIVQKMRTWLVQNVLFQKGFRPRLVGVFAHYRQRIHVVTRVHGE